MESLMKDYQLNSVTSLKGNNSKNRLAERRRKQAEFLYFLTKGSKSVKRCPGPETICGVICNGLWYTEHVCVCGQNKKFDMAIAVKDVALCWGKFIKKPTLQGHLSGSVS